jgi:DNA-binding XRE family transcriptional regulator
MNSKRGSHSPTRCCDTSQYRGRLKGIPIRWSLVRQARLEAGLTLVQIAAGVVRRTAIRHIESGRIMPSLETFGSPSIRQGSQSSTSSTRPMAHLSQPKHLRAPMIEAGPDSDPSLRT